MKKGLKVIWVVIFLFAIFALPTVDVTPVKALGTPQIISINPSSGSAGTNFTVHATVAWDNDFRAIRMCFVNGSNCHESGAPDITGSFGTDGLAPGTYYITVQVAAKGDNNWANPTWTSGQFQVTANQPAPQPSQPPPPSGPSKGPSVNFSFSPSGSQTVGSSVNIHVAVNSSNPGGTKFNVSCGGVSKAESTEVQFDSTWNTNGCDSGVQQVTICSRSTDDPNWANSTCQTQDYSLSPAAVAVPTPSAKFWADSNNIQTGQCTNLYWQTNDADSVNIDGNSVLNSGSKQVCPSVTEKYTLTATNQSGNAYRNITIVVSNQPSPPSSSDVASNFQTGDAIQIGSNVYVIVNGERDLVPNPDTLDALGISRSQINNQGFSDSDLSTIPQGSDIPAVDRDPSGFAAFKNQYFPNTTPINSGPISTVPPVPNSPTQSQQGNLPRNSSCTWYVGARIGLKAGSAIRVGSGMSYGIETIVPSDDWQVDIIDGPRSTDGVTWWDISRKNIDGGGTGWVYFEQAGMSGCNDNTNSTSNSNPNIQTANPDNLNFGGNSSGTGTGLSSNQGPISNLIGQVIDTVKGVFGDFSVKAATVAATPTVNPTTCTLYVYNKEKKIIDQCIGSDYPDAGKWDSWAKGKIANNNPCNVSVNPLYSPMSSNYASSTQVQAGDIVVWHGSCDDAKPQGHVAIFLGWNGDGTMKMDSSDWYGDLNNVHIDSSCMSFIHIPSVSTTVQPNAPSTQNNFNLPSSNQPSTGAPSSAPQSTHNNQQPVYCSWFKNILVINNFCNSGK